MPDFKTILGNTLCFMTFLPNFKSLLGNTPRFKSILPNPKTFLGNTPRFRSILPNPKTFLGNTPRFKSILPNLQLTYSFHLIHDFFIFKDLGQFTKTLMINHSVLAVDIARQADRITPGIGNVTGTGGE